MRGDVVVCVFGLCFVMFGTFQKFGLFENCQNGSSWSSSARIGYLIMQFLGHFCEPIEQTKYGLVFENLQKKTTTLFLGGGWSRRLGQALIVRNGSCLWCKILSGTSSYAWCRYIGQKRSIREAVENAFIWPKLVNPPTPGLFGDYWRFGSFTVNLLNLLFDKKEVKYAINIARIANAVQCHN